MDKQEKPVFEEMSPEGETRSNLPRSDKKQKWKYEGIFNRWFFQYNPLFFFSAFCFLVGVFLVSEGLFETGRGRLTPLLDGAVQLYELLLIGGAWYLYRKAGRRRAGVILGLLEVLFIFDCTFRTEVMAGLKTWGVLTSAAWMVLFSLKLAALMWIFRLRFRFLNMALLLYAGLLAGVFPHLTIRNLGYEKELHLFAVWSISVLAAIYFAFKPRLSARAARFRVFGDLTLDSFACAIAGIILCAHLGAYLYQFSVALSWYHFSPLILITPFVMRRNREAVTWVCAAIALALSLDYPFAVFPCGVMASVVFGYGALKLGQERMFAGSILSLYLAGITFGWAEWPFPDPGYFASFLAATGLVAFAIWRGRWSAFAGIPLVLGHVFGDLYELFSSGIANPNLRWGIVLLVVGFLALLSGVLFNTLARRRAEPTLPGEKREPSL